MKTLARPGDVDDIVRRLRTVRPDSGARWGRMSAHQMVSHLADALRVATGQVAVSAATGPLQRTIVKWTALYLPVRWPPGIPTRPELDQEVGGTKPQDFARDVARVESLLRAFAEHPANPCPAHPIFGPLSQKGWRRWGYLHADHHLRQFGA
jgi:hypothetical protein